MTSHARHRAGGGSAEAKDAEAAVPARGGTVQNPKGALSVSRRRLDATHPNSASITVSACLRYSWLAELTPLVRLDSAAGLYDFPNSRNCGRSILPVSLRGSAATEMKRFGSKRLDFIFARVLCGA